MLVALGGRGASAVAPPSPPRPGRPFFTGMMETTRQDDEMIEAVSLPAARPGSGYAFREVARRHGDFAIVACAAVVDAAIPRARGRRRGGPASRATLSAARDPALDDALDVFAWDLDARDDLHATARYRRELVRRVGRAVIEEAAHAAADRGPAPRRALHAQRTRPSRGEAEPRLLLERLPAPRARRHRHACRLRARRVRRLHHPDRRRARRAPA